MDFKAFCADPAAATNRVLRFARLAPHDFEGAAKRNAAGFWVLKGKASKSNTQVQEEHAQPC
jgi:hypothetical protein